ncbi:MAG: glucose-1-phosphate adenylyltransferase subunit GlgD [Clostridia bacterium]|nr:glucose-1-phosphate adenylyltransferase subunit GlgD [Clostridia bacterium]
MRGNNVLGLVFANVDDGVVSGLTGVRSMASVPFGGNYRMVDFVLSNMVNAGMTKVGILTSNNYQSLMDHIGSGKPWDLSRKSEGLFLLPPFNADEVENYNQGAVGAIKNISNFLKHSNEEYVFLTACSYVTNLDLSAVFEAHEASGADITMLSVRGKVPQLYDQPVVEEKDGCRLTAVRLADNEDGEGEYLLRAALMKKSLLERLVKEAYSKGYTSFEKDILMHSVQRLKCCVYPLDGFCAVVDSAAGYFAANFALLDQKNYDSLFSADRPVFTKVHEDMPATYGLGSDVHSSLIADGCIIDGEVENCILFRNCRVEKGAVVKNSILMAQSFIGENAMLSYCIADKNVSVRPGKTLSGADTYPVYIGKDIQI